MNFYILVKIIFRFPWQTAKFRLKLPSYFSYGCLLVSVLPQGENEQKRQEQNEEHQKSELME